MTEIRASGNPEIGHKDMVMFELAYGFHDGDLKNEGAGNIDIDLRSFRRGLTTGLKNDCNIFFNISKYFLEREGSCDLNLSD